MIKGAIDWHPREWALQWDWHFSPRAHLLPIWLRGPHIELVATVGPVTVFLFFCRLAKRWSRS